MIQNLKSTQALKLAKFVAQLIKLYGYQFQIPSREIAKEIGGISYVTVRKYLSILEQYGFVSRELKSRYNGNIYTLNKRKCNILAKDGVALSELIKIFP